MEHALTTLIEHVGPLAYLIVLVGVGMESMGVPVPGETVLVAATLMTLTARDGLAPAAVAAAAWTGAVAGDNLGYLAGRRWGHRLTRHPALQRLYDERRLATAERFFRRYGVLAVFAGRFVAILRIFAGPLAGMHRMPWTRFFPANLLGGALWVAAVVAVVRLAGPGAVSLVSRSGWLGLAAVAVLLAAAYAWHRRRVRRECREGERLLAEGGRQARGAEGPPGPATAGGGAVPRRRGGGAAVRCRPRRRSGFRRQG
jgi:phosphatidylglycerol lysyltransferase